MTGSGISIKCKGLPEQTATPHTPTTWQLHSFAFGCMELRDDFQCLCKQGYSGAHCERCAAGYYGEPLRSGGSCQLCTCDEGYLCHPSTGECEYPYPNTDDLRVCDICIQKLTDELEQKDSDLYTLKDEPEEIRNISASLTALMKMEDTLNVTEVLVMNYSTSVQRLEPNMKELERDVNSLRRDLRELKAKAKVMSSVANELLKDLDRTQRELLTNTEELLKRINDLLEQLRMSNSSVPTEDELRQTVNQMRRQNCDVHMTLAVEELREAREFLDDIMTNHTDALDSQNLLSQVTELKDLEETLQKSEDTINKTSLIRDGHEATLSDIQKHCRLMEEDNAAVSGDLPMVRKNLRQIINILMMMEILKDEFANLAAELDGASQKLRGHFSAIAKDDIFSKAEERAQNLMDIVMQLQMSLLNYTNTPTVQKTIGSISAYTNVIDALKMAEAVANETHEAADQALRGVKTQNQTKMAEELKNSTSILSERVKKTENYLKDDIHALLNQAKDTVKMANNTLSNTTLQLKDISDDLNKIHISNYTAVLLSQAKDAVEAANNTLSNVTAWLKDISDDLDKIHISNRSSDVDSILISVNSTLNELSNVLPNLTETLADVENQSSQVSIRANITDSIMRIKDSIENTRNMANQIRGPILFTGDSHIELRLPKYPEDLRDFTVFNLTLHRPKHENHTRHQRSVDEDNLFVLYLGSKKTLKDYVAMVVRNSVLYCVYKLGGVLYEIKTREITKSRVNNSFMDRVDFRRVYQDAEVIYTQNYTSSEPQKLPPMTNIANTTVSLLDFDPDDVVLYVGGYPNDFSPPEELNYPNFRGCIEFSTLNEHILSLYNFQNAVNITNTDKCMRDKVPQEGHYFDGSGYGKINMTHRSQSVRFSILSRQKNALLFYMGHKDSFFTVNVEEGVIVLQIRQGNLTLTEKSNKTVFPVKSYQEIRLILNSTTQVLVLGMAVNVTIDYMTLLTTDTEAYVGGIPAAIAARHNINDPPFRGCLKLDENDTFIEEVGIVPGCPVDLLGLREASLKLGSSLAFTPNISQNGTGARVSMGFKSTNTSEVLLYPDSVELSEASLNISQNGTGARVSIGFKSTNTSEVLLYTNSVDFCNKLVGQSLAYHLYASSQLQYNILPQELNFRPHFSLDVRTRSKNGLLLHIADKQRISRVVLFMAHGMVKLSVGGEVLIYQKKINDGDWHNIRFSVEKHTVHLVVDGVRVPDGQLKMDEGISMVLQAPVFVGKEQVQLARAQGKPFPKKSVIGCIRDFRFYDVLVGKPDVNCGGAPCFDGATAEGAYFDGDGSYIVLKNYFVLGMDFYLTFEVHPRNGTGLLFYCKGHQGHSFSVFLKEAKMVVQMNDGAREYNTSVTVPSPLCDPSFHHVTVTKSGNALELRVGKDSDRALIHSVPSQAHETLYIGGVPEKNRKRVHVWTSFVGCMKNVQINQIAVSFQSLTSVFGPVNTYECPAD
ncbi:laminin subunit alpha-3 isoform X2 [Hoplias malabaricus]|uniref:laminin subunit alpha-3 isoform X2 n=1 Tax=Hoplias malabaricus TaxID=27720 RepID=UPI0034637D57